MEQNIEVDENNTQIILQDSSSDVKNYDLSTFTMMVLAQILNTFFVIILIFFLFISKRW